VEDRTPFLTALDKASIDLDIGPFCRLHSRARPLVDGTRHCL